MHVAISWFQAPSSANDVGELAREQLRRDVAAYQGVSVDPVSIGAACRRCGGDHGRPVALVKDGSGPAVSLTYRSGLVMCAVHADGAVGIDAEAAGTVTADLANVIRGPAEGSDGADLGRSWVRKEAVLKVSGYGLLADPRHVDVRSDRIDPLSLPGWEVSKPAGSSIWLADLTPSPDYIGAVAVAAAARPDIRIVQAEAAALPRTASA